MVFAQIFLQVVGNYEGHLPLSESRWGSDSTERWWEHLNTILCNRTCLNSRGGEGQKTEICPWALAGAICGWICDQRSSLYSRPNEPPSWNLHGLIFYK